MSKQICRISKKRSNFSIISNTVAQALNYNLAALGLYVYLFSLPHDWEFHKSHLRKVCDIGEKKLNNLLAILSEHKLINVIQTRNENGQFSHFDIQIDDGTAFIHNPQPDGQNCRPVKNGGAVKQTYKEDIKAFKKEDKKQEREPLSFFEPDEANQILCSEYGLSIDDEIKSFMSERHRGKKTQYEFERWLKNGYEYKKGKQNGVSGQKNIGESHSTVQFWNPSDYGYKPASETVVNEHMEKIRKLLPRMMINGDEKRKVQDADRR